MASAPTVTPTSDSGLDASSDEELRLLTVDEVATILRLKPWAVNERLKSGEIPSVYLGAKSRRVRLSDLRTYIEGLPTTRPSS